MKEEPEHYGYDQLERDRKTVWAGVRNPLAQKHLRTIRKGDRIFYYHTGKEKAVVAIAQEHQVGQVGPTAEEPVRHVLGVQARTADPWRTRPR